MSIERFRAYLEFLSGNPELRSELERKLRRALASLLVEDGRSHGEEHMYVFSEDDVNEVLRLLDVVYGEPNPMRIRWPWGWPWHPHPVDLGPGDQGPVEQGGPGDPAI